MKILTTLGPAISAISTLGIRMPRNLHLSVPKIKLSKLDPRFPHTQIHRCCGHVVSNIDINLISEQELSYLEDLSRNCLTFSELYSVTRETNIN